MKVDKARPHFFGLMVLGLLAASFLVFGVAFQPARAFPAPNVANTVATDSGGSSSGGTFILTVAAKGDEVAAFVQTFEQSLPHYVTVTGLTSPGVTGGFTQITTNTALCIGASSFCGGVGQNYHLYNSLWVGTATSTGAITVTVALNGTADAGWGEQGYDVQFVNGNPAFSLGSCSGTKTGDCGNPFGTSPSLSFTSGDAVEVSGSIAVGNVPASSATAGMSYVGNNPSQNFGGLFSTSATSVTSPTTFAMNFNTNSGAASTYNVIGAVFSNLVPTTTVTTTVNTNCLGAGCSGGHNATSTYFSTSIPPLFVFYASQNTASGGQIDNFTMKVKAVHITAPTGTLRIGIYQATTPTTVPSGGNPYALLKEDDVTVTNGTTDFFIHANPQANICASCYYAAGIMAATTASRGSGATGSGVSFYESSQVGVTQYQFNPGATTLPASFFTANSLTPDFFMFIHETYNVALVTSTVTTTQGATATTTTTSTVTSTTLDMNLAVQSGADYGILAMVILLPAFALMVPIAVYTKSAMGAGIGFVAGLMLGSALGVQAALVPPVFLGITVIIGIFVIVGLSRSGGGP